MPVQFLTFAVLALVFLALVARRRPTADDLALKAGLTRRDLLVIAIVFVVTHVLFWLLGFATQSQENQAVAYFRELKLDGPLIASIATIVSTVILAPVCEEILYRGAILRPLHDALARRGRATLGAVVGILVSAVMFAMRTWAVPSSECKRRPIWSPAAPSASSMCSPARWRRQWSRTRCRAATPSPRC